MLVRLNSTYLHALYTVSACPFSWAKQWYAEAHVVEEGSGALHLGQIQRRMRRHRTIFTEEQLDALEELFLQNQYPDINTREQLAQRTHLREERVEVSFPNTASKEDVFNGKKTFTVKRATFLYHY